MPLVLVPTAFEAGLLFGADTRARLEAERHAHVQLAAVRVGVALCGFGLAAAGAGAAHAIARYPGDADRVLLVGIAGTYRPRTAPVGSVVAGTFARCSGIGAGSARRHLSAEQMGWPQGLALPGQPPVMDTAPLHVPPLDRVSPIAPQRVVAGGLLSVAAASGSTHQAASRAKAYPDALAEEMEAFPVALAARLAGVPLVVLRGISNRAGDRDVSRWRARDAMNQVRNVLEHVIARL